MVLTDSYAVTPIPLATEGGPRLVSALVIAIEKANYPWFVSSTTVYWSHL